MEALARRYRGRIGSWELWNEPDNADYWRGSVAEYAALLREGARGVRLGDPGAQVVSGGLAGNVAFLGELFAGYGVGPLVDVVNVHAYFETWNGEPLERLTGYLDDVAEAVRPAHGSRPPLWLAEVGYGNYRRGAEVSPGYRATYRYEHTPAFAASALVRTMALALDSPWIDLVAWYELKDPSPRAPVIGDVNNRHLGVASFDHRPKPAFESLRFVGSLFREEFRALAGLRARPATEGIPAQVHGFLLADGMAVVMAWIPTNPPGVRRPASPAGDLEDSRRAQLVLELPCSGAREARLHDEQGRALGQPVSLPRGPRPELPVELGPAGVTVVTVAGCAPAPPLARGKRP
jgi:hypothetical protein